MNICLNKPQAIIGILFCATALLSFGLSDEHPKIAVWISRLCIIEAVLFNIFTFL